jgi:hypothetical protein
MRFSAAATTGGEVELLVDGASVARGPIRRTTPIRFSLTGHGLWCGRGGNLAVCDDYAGPFPWAGTLRRVTVDVSGRPAIDPEGEADAALAAQ